MRERCITRPKTRRRALNLASAGTTRLAVTEQLPSERVRPSGIRRNGNGVRMPRSIEEPRARCAWRLHSFSMNRHE